MLGLRKTADEAVQQGDRFFCWRGGDVSRLESLFDAIIALALTLIVVSVEVPNSFDELLVSFRKLPAFAICFAILLMCWYYHFLFHRRYGIEDYPIVLLNSVLMFLVVFYVYPLKFLYSFMFAASSEVAITVEQVPTLMTMYSGGFVSIFVLLFLMYAYALMKRDGLHLNVNEILLTKSKLSELSIYILVGLISVVFATVLREAVWAGLVYFLIGPLQGLNGYFWGKWLVEDELQTKVVSQNSNS